MARTVKTMAENFIENVFSNHKSCPTILSEEARRLDIDYSKTLIEMGCRIVYQKHHKNGGVKEGYVMPDSSLIARYRRQVLYDGTMEDHYEAVKRFPKNFLKKYAIYQNEVPKMEYQNYVNNVHHRVKIEKVEDHYIVFDFQTFISEHGVKMTRAEFFEYKGLKWAEKKARKIVNM